MLNGEPWPASVEEGAEITELESLDLLTCKTQRALWAVVRVRCMGSSCYIVRAPKSCEHSETLTDILYCVLQSCYFNIVKYSCSKIFYSGIGIS